MSSDHLNLKSREIHSPDLQVVVGIIFSAVNTAFGLTLVIAYTADTRKTLKYVMPVAEEDENPTGNSSVANEMNSEIKMLEMEWKSQVQHLVTMEEGTRRDRVKK